MKLKMAATYKGIPIPAAVFTVEYITIQNNQLDFYLSMRAEVGAYILSGEYYGCSYDSSSANLEEQAYNYIKNLPEFSSAIYI